MRVSLRWLKELLPGLVLGAGEVAERLAAAGLAVDGLREVGVGLESLVIAQVRAVEPHPKRAQLSLVSVDRGGSQERVVCGASNVPGPGGLVVLAPLGAKLPGMPEPLVAREIGGVTSAGMLCSEAELGLAESSAGILILSEHAAQPGTPFVTAFPEARDAIFELDVTPNRPDALGHVGVARELAALLNLPFALPEAGSAKQTSDVALSGLVRVDNQDLERCPHYAAGVVLDIQVAPSPAWLRWRLSRLGVRPISNVVDITNFLLLEFGQPLHAFDLDRVSGGQIVVRRARAQEPFTTLDGVPHLLDADDLVICDADGPSALAGVMGGQNSEIRAETRRVLLECAYFSPRGIRRAARRHGLHTESSHRFERGVDRAAVPRVLERAKNLLSELASGAVVAGAVHVAGPDPERSRIRLRSARLDALLGAPVPFAEALDILERLGFEVAERNSDAKEASVLSASFRPDVALEVDLIEEVARVRGLDQIPNRLPAIAPQPPGAAGKLEREVADIAVALGLYEAVTYAFVSPAELEALHAPSPTVRLLNPLGVERSVMRTSLLPGLLEALRRARRHGEARARLFTIGTCFGAPVTQVRGGARPRLLGDLGMLPREDLGFAAVLAGSRSEYLVQKSEEVDVFDAKGYALELVERVTGRRAEARFVGTTADTRHLHPRGAAEVLVGNARVGRFGPLHPDVIDALDVGGSLQVIELDLEALTALGKVTPAFAPIPRLPAAIRDLSLVVPEAVAAGDVAALLARAGGELCESVELVALYRGGSVPEGQKSLTFRIICRDPKARTLASDARTLTDREVDDVQSQMLKMAQTEFGASLRA